MFKQIAKVGGNLLRGGLRALAEKVDEIIDVVNSTQQINGDGFILIDHVQGIGMTVRLDINQVLSRIPKQYSRIVEVKLTPAAAGAGSNGTSTSPATWVYDVVDYDTHSISYGTSISPTGQRPNGEMTQAVYGLAKITNGSPACRIIWCDEVPPTVVGCTSS